MLNKNYFRRNISKFQKLKKNNFSNKNEFKNPEKYSYPLSLFHWGQGTAIMALVVTGYIASRIKINENTPKEEKEKKRFIMHLHKSMGVLNFGLIFFRLFFRIKSNIPVHNVNKMEKFGAKFGHYSLYLAMILMPVTGIGMGHFGGWVIFLFF